MQYQDTTSTIPASNELVLHNWKMENDPQYAANVTFQQATANQGLQDMSAMFIPAGRLAQGTSKGLGIVGKSGEDLARQQQLLRAGEQAKTAELFAAQDALKDATIMSAAGQAKGKGLGRIGTAEEFATQQVLRDQSILQGEQAARLAKEYKALNK